MNFCPNKISVGSQPDGSHFCVFAEIQIDGSHRYRRTSIVWNENEIRTAQSDAADYIINNINALGSEPGAYEYYSYVESLS